MYATSARHATTNVYLRWRCKVPFVVEVIGVAEAVAGLNALPDGITEEIMLTADVETRAIANDYAYYPPQPASASDYKVYVRGEGWLYNSGKTYPTSEQFGEHISVSVRREGNNIVAELSSGASYTVYIRGSTDESSEFYDRVAWMHSGVWEPVTDIVDRHVPKVENAVDVAVARVAQILGF